MQSTSTQAMRSDRAQAADSRSGRPSRRAQPVRLPAAAAELVNRMLAARLSNR